MNRIKQVIKLANKLKSYVDEVVIIDSSRKKDYELLKRKLKFAKVVWLPPVGMADLYYKIGLDLTSYEWIFHLDDDELPSDKLLNDLKKLIKDFGSVYPVFAVKRINTAKKGLDQFLFRIFRKDMILPTGTIHWVWASKTKKILKLDSRDYYILHNEDVLLDFKKNLKRLWKYSIIESYQYGYKVLTTIYNRNIFKYQNTSSVYYKIFKYVYSFINKLNNRVALLIAASLYNLFFLYYGLFKIKKVPIQSLIYSLFIQINLIRNFNKKYRIWLKIYEKGDPIRYLHLDSIESFRMAYMDFVFDPNDGLKNFIKMMERWI